MGLGDSAWITEKSVGSCNATLVSGVGVIQLQTFMALLTIWYAVHCVQYMYVHTTICAIVLVKYIDMYIHVVFPFTNRCGHFAVTVHIYVHVGHTESKMLM